MIKLKVFKELTQVKSNGIEYSTTRYHIKRVISLSFLGIEKEFILGTVKLRVVYYDDMFFGDYHIEVQKAIFALRHDAETAITYLSNNRVIKYRGFTMVAFPHLVESPTIDKSLVSKDPFLLYQCYVGFYGKEIGTYVEICNIIDSYIQERTAYYDNK
jgi:hypothetical protein